SRVRSAALRQVESTKQRSLSRKMNPRTGAYLFISKAVGRTIKFHYVHALRRCGARRTPAHDDVVAGLQGKFCHPDLHKLGEVVQFEFPPLVFRVNQDKGMWIDEVKFCNDTVDRHLPGVVVYTRDRMMDEQNEDE